MLRQTSQRGLYLLRQHCRGISATVAVKEFHRRGTLVTPLLMSGTPGVVQHPDFALELEHTISPRNQHLVGVLRTRDTQFRVEGNEIYVTAGRMSRIFSNQGDGFCHSLAGALLWQTLMRNRPVSCHAANTGVETGLYLHFEPGRNIPTDIGSSTLTRLVLVEDDELHVRSVKLPLLRYSSNTPGATQLLASAPPATVLDILKACLESHWQPSIAVTTLDRRPGERMDKADKVEGHGSLLALSKLEQQLLVTSKGTEFLTIAGAAISAAISGLVN